MAKIRFEAESLTLKNYIVENVSFASSGALAKISGGTTGSIETRLDSAFARGTYTFSVSYFDESDGESPMSLYVDGDRVDTWTFDENPGGSRASTSNRRTRRISSDVLLKPGSKIELRGGVSRGENARVDYFEIEPTGGSSTPPPAPPTSNRSVNVEAEQMTLSGYTQENASFASGGKLIRLPNGIKTGTATTQFSGEAGTYDLKLTYHDESDGEGKLQVKVDGQIVDSWILDENTRRTRASTDNRRERVIRGLSLNANSKVQVMGTSQAGEVTRVDKLRFVPTEAGGGGNSGGGNSGDTSEGGIILNLQEGVRLSPIFGAIKNPRILALGDSITAGQHRKGAVPGGYRIRFEERANADGYDFDFVGPQNNQSGGLSDGDHAGFPGLSINQIKDWVNKGNLANFTADAILLMIGTNDAHGNTDGKTMYDRLDSLIDAITNAVPNTHLFVSSIPTVDAPRGNPDKVKNINQYNGMIDDLVDEKARQNRKVYFVNAGGTLNADDLNGDNSATNDFDDGLHPTRAGYFKLGDAWYDGVFEPEPLKNKKRLKGTQFDDRLIGNARRNLIDGAGGQDELTGGGGADIFRYKKANQGGDRITDFGQDDTFKLSASGFGGGFRKGTTLSDADFIKGKNPLSTGSGGKFLYNTSNNLLSFDVDGAGKQSAVGIATLTNGFDLQAEQIRFSA